ncbi:putative methanogen marker protein 4 [Methanolinea mesophila]|uniref:methanogenesis marker protein Mmp4/MtxX n=1 Tax=Methanolinea mesophila TaxID=547055 RepID=UPI001AE4E876|nr:methanogenesis marker protein Mmp4/MtxX [Methanolinea mesophila]MBP1929885.1 putative methanogen marker protein 4 [Methanolinea mesophila]
MQAVTIGIGAGEEPEKVLASVRALDIRSRVVIYCRPGTFPEGTGNIVTSESEHPEHHLVDDLFSGRIQAALRGSLPANATLSALKKAAGVGSLERAALLETASGHLFFLAPVGVDEGWTVQEKVAMIGKVRRLAENFGLSPRVAILSGGRFGDVGRHPQVDRTLADAELVARLTGETHFEILIEEAIHEAGVIIAPDGISGNLIFRTLTFLGSGQGHGAPVLNIDKIFVDTSRASPDYANAIRLAESMLKS